MSYNNGNNHGPECNNWFKEGSLFVFEEASNTILSFVVSLSLRTTG